MVVQLYIDFIIQEIDKIRKLFILNSQRRKNAIGFFLLHFTPHISFSMLFKQKLVIKTHAPPMYI